MPASRRYDILSAGELLVDMISADFAVSLDEAQLFKRLPGGSPANLGMNMARLGQRVLLAATLGQDDIGGYLFDWVQKLGVDCRLLRRAAVPTTLILVTRSRQVSNFEAYRGADCQILDEQFPDEILAQVEIFHTTCFALSLPPAQGSIMRAAERAAALGAQLSIDINYAQKIWTDREQAQQLVADYCSRGALVKASEVDWERLYGTKLEDAAAAAAHFLSLGAREACITLGEEGCFVANAKERLFLPARPIAVKDTTGAGDAFWSGYLTAWLDGLPLVQRAMAARRMAELKLGCFGPLPQRVERKEIYEE